MLLELQAGSPAGASITAEHIRSAVQALVRRPEVDFSLDNLVRTHFSAEERRLLRHIATRGSMGAAELEALYDFCPDVAQELRRREYLRADRADRADRYSHRSGLHSEWLKDRSATDIPPFEAPPKLAAQAAIGESADADLPLLAIDDARKRAFLGERELLLTAQEYRFLHCLAKHAGSVVDRQLVATEVWPNEILLR